MTSIFAIYGSVDGGPTPLEFDDGKQVAFKTREEADKFIEANDAAATLFVVEIANAERYRAQ